MSTNVSEIQAGCGLPRIAPSVDPARVVVNADGFAWRSLLVRMPKGLIADDLKEPSIWAVVQKSGRALRKFDHLLVVAFDESWVAECMVAAADASGVELAKPRLTTMPDRFQKGFSDGKYRTEWNGYGWVVARIEDGVQMTQPVANAALAERELARLYPGRIS